jgi:hypothetical protein
VRKNFKAFQNVELEGKKEEMYLVKKEEEIIQCLDFGFNCLAKTKIY